MIWELENLRVAEEHIEKMEKALQKVADKLKDISWECEQGASGEDVFNEIFDAAIEIERWCQS